MLTAAIVALFALISGNLFAQTKRDIAIAYNAALKLDSTDHAAALNKMFDVLGMCKTLGTEADDLNKMSRAVIQQIPNSLAKDKKYDDAFTALNLTIAYAEKNNDAEMKEKAQKQMPKFLLVTHGFPIFLKLGESRVHTSNFKFSNKQEPSATIILRREWSEHISTLLYL